MSIRCSAAPRSERGGAHHSASVRVAKLWSSSRPDLVCVWRTCHVSEIARERVVGGVRRHGAYLFNHILQHCHFRPVRGTGSERPTPHTRARDARRLHTWMCTATICLGIHNDTQSARHANEAVSGAASAANGVAVGGAVRT